MMVASITTLGSDMKTVTTSRLLATSASVAGIEKMLNEFYASNSYRVNADLSVWHPTLPVAHLRVIRRGKRLRLELTRTESTAI